MNSTTYKTVTITVNMNDLRKRIMFGLNHAADNMVLQSVYGRGLNNEGIEGVLRIHNIFFPGEDVARAIEKPEYIMDRAKSILIDAWSGLTEEKEPPLEKLLEVEKLLFRYRYENWFEEKYERSIYV